MKKWVGVILFILLFSLVGCFDFNQLSEDEEKTVENISCVITDNQSTLVGLSDYSNIKRSSICELYVDILTDISEQNGFNGNIIIFYDENELVFLNTNQVFYRYKNKKLEAHDINEILYANYGNTPEALSYDKEKSMLYFTSKPTSFIESTNPYDFIGTIYSYDMDQRLTQTLSFDFGASPSFAYGSTAGFVVIGAFGETTHFDHHFNLITHSKDIVFLGGSRYQVDEHNEVILIGEVVNNQCKVTLYRKNSTKTVILNDSCSSVMRLNVLSSFVYFVINYKLYKFDPTTDTFSLVPLTMNDETVNYISTSTTFRTNSIFGLGLSKNGVTLFNHNMDILQSSNDMEVYQVGETFYLAKKPNTKDIYVYQFDRTEIRKIEESFINTRHAHNHLIINTTRCTFFYCQNIYKNGVDLVLSNIQNFHAVNHENAIYVDNITNSSYDIMHINLMTNVTKKIMSLNYSIDPYMNYSSIGTTPNGLFVIRDEEKGVVHLLDLEGNLIETTQYIGIQKVPQSGSILFLLRDHKEVITLKYYR